MRRLTILHVTPYWAEAWAYGGIPRVVGAAARALAAAGHRVTVCATDACSSTARLAPGHTRLADGLELRIFPNRSNRLAHDWQCFTPVGLDAYLRAHVVDFDVAHLHACRNLPGLLAARRLRQAGIPFVVTPNGTAPLIERRLLAKRAVDWLGGRQMLQDAAAVLAVSTAERKQLEALGVPATRVHVVPNPIDLGEFARPVTRGAFRARHGLGDLPLVVFLGKITPRKRLDVLVRAFAAVRTDAQLVVAGNDMGGLARALRALRDLGLADRAVATGLLTGAARLQALADADIVVYPSSDEVFGLVPLEALLAGTPVIVADDSGCGEVVREVTATTGGACVVPVGNVVALTHAINRVLDDRAAWRTRAEHASHVVARRFGADAVARTLVSVYEYVARPATSTGALRSAVSVVIPVKNGGSTIAATIASIEAQVDGPPFEIVVVDDRSDDDGSLWLVEAARAGRLRLLNGPGRGASAAMNLGVAAARHSIVCQVDQDVRLSPGWLARLVAVLDADPRCGAVQGHYVRDPDASLLARVMALDLEQRYAARPGGETTHVCTGNVAYRVEALRDAGPFDETLGYGNDNDMSYRLRAAGWRLAHCAAATSVHHWRDGLGGYWRQQYGFGYGRLDVVARHPARFVGDSVSPLTMMLHPVLLATAGTLATLSVGLWLAALEWQWAAIAATVLVAMLAVERAVAGVRAWADSRDVAALLFPAAHLVRDAAWVTAMIAWSIRRLRGRAPRPGHSMRPRPPIRAIAATTGFIPRPERTLVIVPAHNEAAAIAGVVADLREHCPTLDVLVVDDGSTDGTSDALTRCGVTAVRLRERMGVGSAVRAGLRYASRHGYDSAVRVDGDGQHAAADISRLLTPLLEGRADVVVGSRFLQTPSPGRPAVRATQQLLAWGLAALTGQPVTDPTSGFCALGPRATRLLADHHPPGYAEPELRLLLRRSGLQVEEVAVSARPRVGGRTTLTPIRLAEAGARVLLAMLMVPLRGGLRGVDRG